MPGRGRARLQSGAPGEEGGGAGEGGNSGAVAWDGVLGVLGVGGCVPVPKHFVPKHFQDHHNVLTIASDQAAIHGSVDNNPHDNVDIAEQRIEVFDALLLHILRPGELFAIGAAHRYEDVEDLPLRSLVTLS